MARKKKIPAELFVSLDAMITKAADTLRNKSSGLEPFATIDVAEHIVNCAEKEFVGHFKELLIDLICRRVPHVLGETPDRETYQPMIPGIILPRYLAIPGDMSTGQSAGWKRDGDSTPSELDRCASHKAKVIDSHVTERQKIITLAAYARARGCGDDEPIRTVFRDIDTTPAPSDRPQPTA